MFSFNNKFHNNCFQHQREYRNCNQSWWLNKGLMLTILGTIWFVIISTATTTQGAAVYTNRTYDDFSDTNSWQWIALKIPVGVATYGICMTYINYLLPTGCTVIISRQPENIPLETGNKNIQINPKTFATNQELYSEEKHYGTKRQKLAELNQLPENSNAENKADQDSR
uniref:Uncharacterized protein n=1 Tax=Glossina brevipalpis TaxID=37001 RepID=A0A1A9WWM8_9MUSC